MPPARATDRPRRFVLNTQRTVDPELQLAPPAEKGKHFRLFFFGLVIALILLLSFLKLSAETMNLPPTLQEKRAPWRKEGDVSPSSYALHGVAPDSTKGQDLLNHYLNLLEKRSDKPTDPTPPDTLERDQTEEEEESIRRIYGESNDDDDTLEKQELETPKQRMIRERRERATAMKALNEAHEQKLAEKQALVSCGRSCQEKYNAITRAYESLRQEVHTELHSVVFDDDGSSANPASFGADGRQGELVNPTLMRESFERKKARIAEDEDYLTEEDRQLAIEELKEAYAILSNPESRLFYVLYEKKPPISMSKVSTRDPG